MRLPDRKETDVRARLTGGPVTAAPPGLAERAVRQGLRMVRRRRIAQWLLWGFFAVAVGFAVWAVVAEPWVGPPQQTTPQLGW
jgi:ferric-dicitrate binding protein FerR (iron transport regulator)